MMEINEIIVVKILNDMKIMNAKLLSHKLSNLQHINSYDN